ncbi:hypothetical protein EZS27_020961 [termite gut metagenome]|uniref:Uncharacterized protein n=1 Tax=termite gut metagenome TaxID=433724 RepID=A0A5J4R9E2_9ZZZZ
MSILVNDAECAEYIQSIDFQKDLPELFFHDQQAFNEPVGWQTKIITDSPLVKDFPYFIGKFTLSLSK